MSEATVRGTPGLGPVALGPRSPASGEDREAARRISPANYELLVFGLLAAFVTAQWARLVAGAPFGRLALAVAAVCAGAWVLRLIASRWGNRGRARLLAWLAAIATLAAALLAVGLPARLLLPANWGELATNLGSGLEGIEEAHLPYRGADPWIRLTLGFGGPAIVALAAAIAFWPARRRDRRRMLALVVLIVGYAIPVSMDSPSADLLLGVPLLALSACWLWITRLEGSRRTQALALSVAAGVLALPLAARLDSGPVLDYESWDVFGRADNVSFVWDHEYGPLDWPREGATMLTVHSATPLYWKASVLDRFDGFSWQRAPSDDPLATVERQARYEVPDGVLRGRHPEWVTTTGFEVEGLSSQYVTTTGTTIGTRGLATTSKSADGTLTSLGGPLISGSDYEVEAYVPRPTPGQLRRAPATYPERRFASSTVLGLPEALAPGYGVSMPLWGTNDPQVRARVRASAYAETYRLARQWTAGAQTPYEAIRAIEDRLRQDYAYNPNVLRHTYPLDAFLFDDRAGYCQQFAGSMGLMLRMLGIPSRVVAGFAPGTRHSEDGTFEVRDIDAHSWVEAYFRGIGWVAFDPTPAAAPAGSQSLHGELPGTRGAAPEPVLEEARGRSGPDSPAGGAAAGGGDGGGPWAGIALVVGVVTAIGALAGGALFIRRRRALASGTLADAQIGELRAALGRLGWHVDSGATLLGLERRFTAAGRGPLRRYLAMLREHRYAPGRTPPPGPAERRALRSAISAGGLRRRVTGLLAIPPGGPPAPRR